MYCSSYYSLAFHFSQAGDSYRSKALGFYLKAGYNDISLGSYVGTAGHCHGALALSVSVKDFLAINKCCKCALSELARSRYSIMSNPKLAEKEVSMFEELLKYTEGKIDELVREEREINYQKFMQGDGNVSCLHMEDNLPLYTNDPPSHMSGHIESYADDADHSLDIRKPKGKTSQFCIIS